MTEVGLYQLVRVSLLLYDAKSLLHRGSRLISLGVFVLWGTITNTEHTKNCLPKSHVVQVTSFCVTKICIKSS